MKIKHTWSKITGSGLLQHRECNACKCQRYYDMGFLKLVYIDRHGRTKFNRPECIFMNEKL